MKRTSIYVPTSKGRLIAETILDTEYPGIHLYMDNELVAVVELYEDEEVLKCHSYDLDHEEPINTTTLIDFNKDLYNEDSE